MQSVTVVVPTRNRLDRLREAVASARRQDGVSVEIIVIDDASEDGTHQWLSHESQAPGFRSHRFPTPCERSRARNHGLHLASGEFVMFLDDDDALRPGALAALALALRDHPTAVAAVGARWEIFEGQRYARRAAHPRSTMCRDVLPELLFGWSAVSGQNLYPVDVVRAVGGYRETMSLCEDRDLWTRVATRGPVVLVPLVTVDYRYNLGQTRPHWVSFTRARVALRCASTLPPERRTRALAWVRSGRFVENAERSLSLGQYLRGVRLAAAGIAQAPGLFLSPLIGEWVLRRLAGRVARRLVSPLTMSA